MAAAKTGHPITAHGIRGTIPLFDPERQECASLDFGILLIRNIEGMAGFDLRSEPLSRGLRIVPFRNPSEPR